MKVYEIYLKRLLDIVLSFIAFLILLFPMLIILVITEIDSDGSPIFLQTRSGKNRKPFRMIKFRSMSKDTPRHVPSNDLNDLSLTKWQRIMRKYSIDELPQIINIFLGDMSFVGPRPVIPEETDLLDERDKYQANSVMPGLTGWAQINGRDELDYIEKAKYDGEYVKKMSFLFDLKCIVLTFSAVFKHKGVRQ